MKTSFKIINQIQRFDFIREEERHLFSLSLSYGVSLCGGDDMTGRTRGPPEQGDFVLLVLA